EVRLDAVLAGLGVAQRELLGPVAAGRVVTDGAALVRQVVAVEHLLAVRIDHVQVDVGRVGIPGQDDANVERHVLQQARVDRGDVHRLAVSLGPGDDGVELGQGDQVDVGEARVPRAGDDLVQPVDGGLRPSG